MNCQFVTIIHNQRAYKFIDENEYVDAIGPESRCFGGKRCKRVIRKSSPKRSTELIVSGSGDLPLKRLRMIVRQSAINGFVINVDDLFWKKAMTQTVEECSFSYGCVIAFSFCMHVHLMERRTYCEQNIYFILDLCIDRDDAFRLIFRCRKFNLPDSTRSACW